MPAARRLLLPLTQGGSVKLGPMTAWLLANAAEEGRNVITGMLIVGLIFVSVIALGETSRWLRHRRR
jgi:hypothetical protein